MSSSLTLLLIASGGAIGAICRYLATMWSQNVFGQGFPYGTLLVNVVGSFIMGLTMAAINHQWIISPHWRPLIAVGFLGALTTFSSFSMETLTLFMHEEWLKATLNILLNVVLCLIFVTIGYYLLYKQQ